MKRRFMMNYDNHSVTIPIEDYETYKCFKRSIERLSDGIQVVHLIDSFLDEDEQERIEIRVLTNKLESAIKDIYTSAVSGKPVSVVFVNE